MKHLDEQLHLGKLDAGDHALFAHAASEDVGCFASGGRTKRRREGGGRGRRRGGGGREEREDDVFGVGAATEVQQQSVVW
jgi:hypothetical protein